MTRGRELELLRTNISPPGTGELRVDEVAPQRSKLRTPEVVGSEPIAAGHEMGSETMYRSNVTGMIHPAAFLR
ncbi:hypothetical protein RRG08_026684 [Elysia crispata]|uniref:Uncharacterized protein n=1 Tax=Elysia crispata TaxID=231223 RepID=A0AAE1AZC0_9GAST|nr:hypothetical protein RRG08_026684 [Elysia crispata]